MSIRPASLSAKTPHPGKERGARCAHTQTVDSGRRASNSSLQTWSLSFKTANMTIINKKFKIACSKESIKQCLTRILSYSGNSSGTLHCGFVGMLLNTPYCEFWLSCDCIVTYQWPCISMKKLPLLLHRNSRRHIEETNLSRSRHNYKSETFITANLMCPKHCNCNINWSVFYYDSVLLPCFSFDSIDFSASTEALLPRSNLFARSFL